MVITLVLYLKNTSFSKVLERESKNPQALMMFQKPKILYFLIITISYITTYKICLKN